MSDFYRRLDEKERENRIKRIFENRPDNLHDYQGCANDPSMKRLPAEKEQRQGEPRASEAQPLERLNMDLINSLPQPLYVRLAGDKDFSWPLEYIDVETGLLKFDVCGKLQRSHISDVAQFRDSSGTVHDAETFYSDWEAPKVKAQPLEKKCTCKHMYGHKGCIQSCDVSCACVLHDDDPIEVEAQREEEPQTCYNPFELCPVCRQQRSEHRTGVFCESPKPSAVEMTEPLVSDAELDAWLESEGTYLNIRDAKRLIRDHKGFVVTRINR